MSSNAAELASAPPPPLAARAGTLDTLFMLARREFWEHRVLWIAPLVTAVLLALCAVLGHADVDGGSHGAITARQKVALFTVVQWVLAQPLYLVMIFCVSFYL
ncbi:MAG: hypothetical protein ACRETH_00425, partial [Steroidobacteraceae bacterium]